MNIKYQISVFYFLFSVFCLAGCGKKQPIGYDIIAPRAGEIKIATAEIISPYITYSEFVNRKGVKDLFAGKESSFEAIAFVHFKFESLQTAESLLVIGNDSGDIFVCKVLDSLDIDSVNWSSRPQLEVIDTLEIKMGDTCKVGIEGWGEDTTFNIGFMGSDKIVSFNSIRMSINGDSIPQGPVNFTYIDTSYLSQDSIPDSLTFIETGAFATKCTLYLAVSVIDSVSPDSADTVWVKIDSLTDSLREAFSLDSNTINKANFQIIVDTLRSYQWNIGIFAQYETEQGKVLSNTATIQNGTLALDFKPIIDRWFRKGKRLWIVMESSSSEISRVVLVPKLATLSIVYTLPPKARE
ncbi:MAG: hypothetical protein HY769_01800 [Candidatus Stahlbacteria bacterium]|nr:hypothetical protein [Candidatus Stahlbacteria bacterium]